MRFFRVEDEKKLRDVVDGAFSGRISRSKSKLAAEVRAANPEITDFDNLAQGTLLRIPTTRIKNATFKERVDVVGVSAVAGSTIVRMEELKQQAEAHVATRKQELTGMSNQLKALTEQLDSDEKGKETREALEKHIQAASKEADERHAALIAALEGAAEKARELGA